MHRVIGSSHMQGQLLTSHMCLQGKQRGKERWNSVHKGVANTPGYPIAHMHTTIRECTYHQLSSPAISRTALLGLPLRSANERPDMPHHRSATSCDAAGLRQATTTSAYIKLIMVVFLANFPLACLAKNDSNPHPRHQPGTQGQTWQQLPTSQNVCSNSKHKFLPLW